MFLSDDRNKRLSINNFVDNFFIFYLNNIYHKQRTRNYFYPCKEHGKMPKITIEYDNRNADILRPNVYMHHEYESGVVTQFMPGSGKSVP